MLEEFAWDMLHGSSSGQDILTFTHLSGSSSKNTGSYISYICATGSIGGKEKKKIPDAIKLFLFLSYFLNGQKSSKQHNFIIVSMCLNLLPSSGSS